MQAASRPPPGVAVSRGEVFDAFGAWLAKRGDKLDEQQLALARDVFDELIELRTQLYDEWWLRNSYRHQSMREIERRMARVLIRFFLADLSMGKIAL